MRSLYSLLSYLLLPAALTHLVFKAIRDPAYVNRWYQRLGFYRGRSCACSLWLHACSVGEVEASIPLIHTLQQHYPAASYVITTTTPTGSARITSEFGDTVQHVYLPFDVSIAVNAFLNHFQPALSIVVEKEIWPTLFFCCKKKSIPIVLVNAMLSSHSFRQYRNWLGLFKPVFQTISKLGAQTDQVAKRFVQLGVAPECIRVTGNIKFMRIIQEQQKQQAIALKQQLFSTRVIWIAASTHENEERLLLDRLLALQSVIPNLLLVLAPRHPRRSTAILRYCESLSISCVSRSSRQLCSSSTQVYLLDTLGELMLFYGVADVAFIGGSLVDVGCHNLLEPAAWGIPIVFGTSVYNCKDIASGLMGSDAAQSVSDADQCIAVVKNLLQNPAQQHTMGENARNYFNKQQNQITLTLELIDEALNLSGDNRII